MGRKSATLRVWLWISIAAAVMGAFMLYPVGAAGANAVFVIITDVLMPTVAWRLMRQTS